MDWLLKVMLFIAGDASKAQLYDLVKRTVVRTYTVRHTCRYASSYCPMSDTIAVHQTRSCAFFFSRHTQQPLQRSFTPETVSSSQVTPCGSFMIAGTENGNLFVWNLHTGQLIKSCKAHLRAVTCMSFSSDSSLLVTASEDSVCKVWTLAALLSLKLSESHPSAVFTGHTLAVTCCTFCRGAMYVLTGSSDRTCRVFDARTGEQLRVVTVGAAVTAVAVSPNDTSFVAGTADGFLYFGRIYCSRTTLPITADRLPDPIIREPNPDGHDTPLIYLAYDCRNPRLVLTVSEGGVVMWYDSEDGTVVSEGLPKQRWKFLSCCLVPASVSGKPSPCVGLSKNTVDPSLHDYQVRGLTSRGSGSHDGGNVAKKRQRETEVDESERATLEELRVLKTRNDELEELKQKLEVKLRKRAILVSASGGR